ncbi:MAG: glycosyltransferase [Saprospiraceae bacterium]
MNFDDVTCFDESDNVLVAPLNWGLGHATRCIPIIKALEGKVNKVTIAADGASYTLLKREFDHVILLKRIPLYYGNCSAIINMFINIPALIINFILDLFSARSISKNEGISKIISDNRFGFFTRNTYNIYISHQINILHSIDWVANIATQLHLSIIHKFHTLWIPDDTLNTLAGKLSQCQNVKIPIKYLGSLTRIKKANQDKTIDILVILSGVEPQRTIFEKELNTILRSWSFYNIVVIRGVSKNEDNLWPPHINVVPIADTQQVNRYLNSAKLLVARSGYSTLMDIVNLDIKALFIPTPGQTEQEYLAEWAIKNPNYSALTQAQIADKLTLEIESLLKQ